MSKIDYSVILRPLSEAEGGGFLAEVPALLGCYADGETIEQALEAVEDAITSWIKTAKEFGDPIPEPESSL